ncbi:MAG TPA: chromosome partitioning protein ParB, partial [bacterium]
RSTIANMIRLLALPDAVQQDLESGKLTIGHARALLAIADAGRQRHLHKVILGKGLSVRETEALVARERDHGSGRTGGTSGGQAQGGPALDPKWQTAQDRMERKLQTKVTIDLHADKTSGKVSIDFYDLDDFNRIYDLLKGR